MTLVGTTKQWINSCRLKKFLSEWWVELLKACPWKIPILQPHHLKAYLNFDKDHVEKYEFWKKIWSDKTKINYLIIIIGHLFGEKPVKLICQRTLDVLWLFCGKRSWMFRQRRLHHEKGEIYFKPQGICKGNKSGMFLGLHARQWFLVYFKFRENIWK